MIGDVRGGFETQFAALCRDCEERDPVAWALWMRKYGQLRRLHGHLLDSAILDALAEGHADDGGGD